MNEKAMSKNSQLLDDLLYLESAGMTLHQLRLLHHWAGRPKAEEQVTFKSVRRYFSREYDMGLNNSLFAERLHFIAETHKLGFTALVDMAIHALPLSGGGSS